MESIAGELVVHDDPAALARAGASTLSQVARAAVAERGRCAVALTGGSSPVALYRALTTEPYADEIPWRDVHLFWGDDRIVPPAHPRSNFRLAQRLFIDLVPIPPQNVHRIRGELGVRRAVEQYRAELEDFFTGPPSFDLVHLGIGGDGHVASLFPFDTSTLLETGPHVVPALFRELGEWRATLTYPVLNASARVEFILPDAAKAGIARTAMRGPIDPLRIPAQGVRPAPDALVWRVTEEVQSAIERWPS